MRAWFMVQLMTSVFMTGVIWVVQLVHYPAFAWIDPARFTEYSLFHRQMITWIVAPAMLVEAASLLAVWYTERDWQLVACGLLLVVVWAVTSAVSVPLHDRLSQSLDAEAIRQLVFTNWIRTAAWTLKTLLLLQLIPKKLFAGGN